MTLLATLAALATALAVWLALQRGAPARGLGDEASARPRSDAWRWPMRPSRREQLLDAAMPDLLDLLVVTLQAGVPIGNGFRTIAPSAPAPLEHGLTRLIRRLDRGDRLVDAVPVLVEQWGTRALGLVAAISSAEVAGLPLAPTLDRIADDARAHRRRAAEADARRLPVRLAVPLVCCTLPSFVCIAIGPLVVGALSSLRSA